MFPNPALPQEIYDIIIEHLQDDKPSLNACALVASAWRPASQKLLHRTMFFQATLPSPPTEEWSPSAQSSEKARLLLGTSSHVLRYARCFVISGERVFPYRLGPAAYRSSGRVPNATLPAFLRQLSALSLPLLARVELHHLKSFLTTPDLQHAVFLLLSKGSAKEVRVFDCNLPLCIQWLRLVGPETTSLKLDGVTLFDDPDPDPKNSIPISSAPNLINLHIGQIYTHRLLEWILHPFGAPGEPSNHLNSETTTSHSHLFRERITTLSLCYQYHTSMDRVCKLIQGFTGLTTLQFNPYGCNVTFPLNQFVCIPTLNELQILPVNGRQITWLLSSFLTLEFSSVHSTATKPKTIYIHMWVDPVPLASILPPITFPELLDNVRTLDGIVANIPNVEVTMEISASTYDWKDGLERMEKSRRTMEGWHADVKTLKLTVS